MKINLISVGKNMPDWIKAGFDEYQKRLPPHYQLNLIEIPAIKRSKNYNSEQIKNKESQLILAAITVGSYSIALDEHGIEVTTKQLADELKSWQENYATVNLIIGGADGLSQELLNKADKTWSLALLTLPHALVRVVVAEQIYRAWSILTRHPYHRE